MRPPAGKIGVKYDTHDMAIDRNRVQTLFAMNCLIVTYSSNTPFNSSWTNCFMQRVFISRLLDPSAVTGW